MAGTIVPASPLVTRLEGQSLGYNGTTLSNFDTTAEPQIIGNLEIAGSIASFASLESITGWAALSNGAAYIKVVPDTTAGTCTAEFTATAPTWDNLKIGWYGTGANANHRYLFKLTKGGASSYEDKRYLPKGSSENVYVEGNVEIGGTVGDTTIAGTLGVTGNATVGGTLGVTSNTTVGGTLGVTGNTTVGGTLGVTGNTTVGGTLGVTNAIINGNYFSSTNVTSGDLFTFLDEYIPTNGDKIQLSGMYIYNTSSTLRFGPIISATRIISTRIEIATSDSIELRFSSGLLSSISGASQGFTATSGSSTVYSGCRFGFSVGVRYE